MKYRKWIALAALPIAIGLLYGLDSWLDQIRQVAGETLRVGYLFSMLPVINLLYAAVVLGLFLATAQPTPRWVGAVYALTGAVVLAYPSLRFGTGLLFLPPSIRDLLPFNTVIFQPLRGLSLMGAFILAIGVWRVVRKKPALDDSSG